MATVFQLNIEGQDLAQQQKQINRFITQTEQALAMPGNTPAETSLYQSELEKYQAQDVALQAKIDDWTMRLREANIKEAEAKAKAEAAIAADAKIAEVPKPAENVVKDDAPVVSNATTTTNTNTNAATNDAANPSSPAAGSAFNQSNLGARGHGEVGGIPDESNPLYNLPNKRQYNPLSLYSSYTYNISLFALAPEAYNDWNKTGKWVTKDLELLVQSGGANKTLDSKRNKFFEYDFGIDELEIISLITGKETASAGNQANFKFKVYEPYSMSFVSRLTRAQVEIQSRSAIKKEIIQEIQSLSCPLLLVVRFYGYDVNGTLVKNLGDGYASDTKTDSNANFERAFPIIISKLSFRLDNKVTTYDIEAKMYNQQIAFSQKRGTIKSVTTLQGGDVQSVLHDLMSKLNSQQKNLTLDNQKSHKGLGSSKAPQKIADIYEIIFEDKSGISDALIVNKDFYNKTYTPIADITDIKQVNERLSNRIKSVPTTVRNVTIAEGTPIIQAIDQVITQSTFVKDALDTIDKEWISKTQQQDSTTEANDSPIELCWYHIRSSLEIIGHDDERNDYAHKIIYNIIKYRTPYVQSLYLNKAIKYHGAHKIYEYYYTGKNTEIIDYNMSYNTLYFILGAMGSQAANANNSSVLPNSKGGGYNADSTNMLPGAFELINSMKTYLYSPKDALDASITILGDPDYLMPAEAGSLNDMFKLWYGPDFTINPGSGQVYIEIGFKQVDDYYSVDPTFTGPPTTNAIGGLLNPNNNITFWAYPQGSDIEKRTNGRMVYLLTKVTSRFQNGIFKQELKSVIPDFSTQGSASADATARTDTTVPNANSTRPDVVSAPTIVKKDVPRTNSLSTTSSNSTASNASPSTSTTSSKDDNIPKPTTKSLIPSADERAAAEAERAKTISRVATKVGNALVKGANTVTNFLGLTQK